MSCKYGDKGWIWWRNKRVRVTVIRIGAAKLTVVLLQDADDLHVLGDIIHVEKTSWRNHEQDF